jgi:signal peptidase I
MKPDPRAKTDEQNTGTPADISAPASSPPANRFRATCNWFLSKTVRHASAMRKHVQKILDHQRDILSPQSVAAVQSALFDLDRTINETPQKEPLERQMEKLEKAVNDPKKGLRPYPNAAWRENFEVLLVALTVAMGIRTFFLQPFKIPTGSMQPTLYGVTSNPDALHFSDGTEPDFQIPTGWQRVRDWFAGVSYLDIKAKIDGELAPVKPPIKILIFNIYQELTIGGKSHSIWFPPDYGSETLEQRAGLAPGAIYHKGDQVLRMRVTSGDHLFVDRITYNFRPPRRGEIIVFETKGIPEENRDRFRIPADQFYIKRLVGLGGETLKLGRDRHLIVNGKRLDSSTPHFEKVYSFNPGDPSRESHYSGHVDTPMLAPFFHEHPEGVSIPPDHYMVMGDNTMNSLDSRAWGYFPAQYVIGRSFFVYWPLTDRFGWGYHR